MEKSTKTFFIQSAHSASLLTLPFHSAIRMGSMGRMGKSTKTFFILLILLILPVCRSVFVLFSSDMPKVIYRQ